MNKLRIAFAASLVITALFLYTGCPAGTEDDGSTTSVPVLDHVPSFDINNLPDPSYWNSLGHIHVFPDLFTFADGNKVKKLADWER
ncbi:MAG: hypothetical protein LBB68_00150 [Treponema sp.]|jgi:ABC-type oligopeptide transport system substrate-binding subunit|nr:hypothetical protein [Treponema sp.]